MKIQQSAMGFAICLVMLLSVGCGPSEPVFKMGTVSGLAKIGDEPFDADAVLMFLDQGTGQAYTAAVSEDGSFTIDGEVRVGTYTVYVAPPSANSASSEPAPVTMDQSLPDKYWNEGMSDLKIEVVEGENKPTVVFEAS